MGELCYNKVILDLLFEKKTDMRILLSCIIDKCILVYKLYNQLILFRILNKYCFEKNILKTTYNKIYIVMFMFKHRKI